MISVSRQPLRPLRALQILAVASVSFAGCGRIGYEPWPDKIGTSLRGGASAVLDGSGSGGVGVPQDGGSVGAGGTFMSAGGTSDGGGASQNGAGGAVSAGGATNDGGTRDASNGAGGAASSGGATGPGGASTGGAGASGGVVGSGGSGDGSVCTITNSGAETCDGLDNDCNGVTDDGGICGPTCTGATYGGHAYAFCSTTRTFAAAETDCVAKAMRLAKIDDSAENTFLAGIAFTAYAPAYNTASIWPWFGAYDSANPVQWQFLDGTVFWSGKSNGSAVGGLYSNWGAANPGDTSGTYCATLNHATGFAWIDRTCTELRAYLCEAY